MTSSAENFFPNTKKIIQDKLCQKELIRITERQGEQEFEWYALSSTNEEERTILEQFFGDLDDAEENAGEYYTSDWFSAVWIHSRTKINDEEEAIIKKFILL